MIVSISNFLDITNFAAGNKLCLFSVSSVSLLGVLTFTSSRFSVTPFKSSVSLLSLSVVSCYPAFCAPFSVVIAFNVANLSLSSLFFRQSHLAAVMIYLDFQLNSPAFSVTTSVLKYLLLIDIPVFMFVNLSRISTSCSNFILTRLGLLHPLVFHVAH